MLLEKPVPAGIDFALIPLGDAAEVAGTGIVASLRRAGLSGDMAYKGNMKKRMAKADAAGARFAILVGDDELHRGEAGLKDLATGMQVAMPFDRLAEAVRAR